MQNDLSTTKVTAQAVLVHLRPAMEDLSTAIDDLAASSMGRVSGDWVRSMQFLISTRRRIDLLVSVVASLASYSYAAESNLSYCAAVTSPAGTNLTQLKGRFRLGRDGDGPGEKQVDTLCAISSVVEATRDALSRTTAHAVILLSDDDDLTPALRYAAQLAHNSPVRVVAAGSITVGSRHGHSAPVGPEAAHRTAEPTQLDQDRELSPPP
jgi:hypothetical protein